MYTGDTQIGWAGTTPYDPMFNRRLTAFNCARQLFPYDKPVKVEDIVSAAKQIDEYFHESK